MGEGAMVGEGKVHFSFLRGTGILLLIRGMFYVVRWF